MLRLVEDVPKPVEESSILREFGPFNFDKMMTDYEDDLRAKVHQAFNTLSSHIRTRKYPVNENRARFDLLLLENFQAMLKGDTSPTVSLYMLAYHLDMGDGIDLSVDENGKILVATDNEFVGKSVAFMIREFGIRMELAPFDPLDIFRVMYPWSETSNTSGKGGYHSCNLK